MIRRCRRYGLEIVWIAVGITLIALAFFAR